MVLVAISCVQAMTINSKTMRVIVRQSAEDFSTPDSPMLEPETYDDYYLLIDAFINGAKLWTFLPNVQDCSYYSHIFLNDYNATTLLLQTYNTTEDENAQYNAVRNLSQLISNQFAEAYLYCHLTVVDGYVFRITE
jgi:hypothetical protein